MLFGRFTLCLQADLSMDQNASQFQSGSDRGLNVRITQGSRRPCGVYWSPKSAGRYELRSMDMDTA